MIYDFALAGCVKNCITRLLWWLIKHVLATCSELQCSTHILFYWHLIGQYTSHDFCCVKMTTVTSPPTPFSKYSLPQAINTVLLSVCNCTYKGKAHGDLPESHLHRSSQFEGVYQIFLCLLSLFTSKNEYPGRQKWVFLSVFLWCLLILGGPLAEIMTCFSMVPHGLPPFSICYHHAPRTVEKRRGDPFSPPLWLEKAEVGVHWRNFFLMLSIAIAAFTLVLKHVESFTGVLFGCCINKEKVICCQLELRKKLADILTEYQPKGQQVIFFSR